MTSLGIWGNLQHGYLCEGIFKCQSLWAFSLEFFTFSRECSLSPGRVCDCQTSSRHDTGSGELGWFIMHHCLPPIPPPTLSLSFEVPDVLDFVMFLVHFLPPQRLKVWSLRERSIGEKQPQRYVTGITLFSKN